MNSKISRSTNRLNCKALDIYQNLVLKFLLSFSLNEFLFIDNYMIIYKIITCWIIGLSNFVR